MVLFWKFFKTVGKARVYQNVSKFLKLPDKHSRQPIRPFVRSLINPFTAGEEDDTYIYYKVIVSSFRICCFLSAIYMAAYLTGWELKFLGVSGDHDRLVNDIAWSYSRIGATILLITMIPYAIGLFRANIDLRQFDLIWWNPEIIKASRGHRKKLLRMSFIGISVLIILLYGLAGVIELISGYQLYQGISSSPMALAIILIIYTFAYPFFIHALIKTSAIFLQHKKRLGPRYDGISQFSDEFNT